MGPDQYVTPLGARPSEINGSRPELPTLLLESHALAAASGPYQAWRNSDDRRFVTLWRQGWRLNLPFVHASGTANYLLPLIHTHAAAALVVVVSLPLTIGKNSGAVHLIYSIACSL